jgi:hypothetical protein
VEKIWGNEYDGNVVLEIICDMLLSDDKALYDSGREQAHSLFCSDEIKHLCRVLNAKRLKGCSGYFFFVLNSEIVRVVSV